ncbi:transposase [Glutamicibacter protophormiae]
MTTCPDVSTIGASTVIAQIGADMDRREDSRCLCSWAWSCPRQHQTGRWLKSP